MTSQPAASSDDAARSPATCKRPGCGRPLPAPGRGRNRVFCSDDCAQRYHNDARIPAPAGTVTGDQDPLTALDALTRQIAVLVRASREQAASTTGLVVGVAPPQPVPAVGSFRREFCSGK